MRVSDAERSAVANALCRHFGDGRLDEEEFNQRQARVAAAKTQADLASVLIDLPPLAPLPPMARPHQPHPVRSRALIGALIVIAVVWSVSSAVQHLVHPHIPWALIGLIAVGFVAWRRGNGRHR
jgi:hypothetical protein